MVCPLVYYDKLCREADRINRNEKEPDIYVGIKVIEQRLEEADHTPEFYFNCGMAASNIANEAKNEEDKNIITELMEGLGMFMKLIHLKCEKDDEITE